MYLFRRPRDQENGEEQREHPDENNQERDQEEVRTCLRKQSDQLNPEAVLPVGSSFSYSTTDSL